MCRLYGKFASYLRRVLCKTRLIFPRINGPIVFQALRERGTKRMGEHCYVFQSSEDVGRSGLCLGVITWNVKRFVTSHLGSFLEYGLSVELMYFFCSFWSLHLIWKYFLAGPSPTMSNFIHNVHVRDFKLVVICTGKLWRFSTLGLPCE